MGELLYYCSQVSLLNQCLPQTDAFLKTLISLIPEIPEFVPQGFANHGKIVHSEEKVLLFIRSLLSLLLLVPGHPENGPFYITQGLVNAIKKYPWQENSGIRTKVCCDILALLCSYAQDRFPYNVFRVDSNDVLYAGATEYSNDLKEKLNFSIHEVIEQLTLMGKRPETSAKLIQARMILDFTNQLISRMATTYEMIIFVVKLLDVISKSKSVFGRSDLRYFHNTLEFVLKKVEKGGLENSAKLRESLVAMK